MRNALHKFGAITLLGKRRRHLPGIYILTRVLLAVNRTRAISSRGSNPQNSAPNRAIAGANNAACQPPRNEASRINVRRSAEHATGQRAAGFFGEKTKRAPEMGHGKACAE